MSTLNEEILRLKNAKAAIDEVLIARGVSVPENATLDTYNELINSIQGGTSSEEVTATKANVLAGTTTITADSNDEIVEGTMPNNSGQAKGTDNVYFDDSYMHVTVKYPGYYDENSTIRINKGNLGDATADKVLEGTTYSSSEGLNLSGNIPIKSADTYFASTNDSTIDAGQYLGGAQTIKGLAQTNFSPANIKTGVTVKINNGDRDLFYATGTFGGDATLDNNARMLNGYIAYGKDGTKYTGSIGSKAAATYYATTSDQTIASGQYLSGVQTIKALSQSNLSAGNILKGKTITISNGNTNVWSVAGSLAVTSAISFSATTLSTTSIRISWTNPSKGPWEGVEIRISTSSSPGVSGGSLAYRGRGNSTAASGSNYVDITGLTYGTLYYFTCTSYASGLGNGSSYNVSARTSDFVLYDGSSLQNGATWASTLGTEQLVYACNCSTLANKNFVVKFKQSYGTLVHLFLVDAEGYNNGNRYYKPDGSIDDSPSSNGSAYSWNAGTEYFLPINHFSSLSSSTEIRFDLMYNWSYSRRRDIPSYVSYLAIRGA